jgi:hypothetical protein
MKLFNYLTVLFFFILFASCGSTVGFQSVGETPEGDANIDEAAIVAAFIEETFSPDPEPAVVDQTEDGVSCKEGYELVDFTKDKSQAIIEMNLRILDAISTLMDLDMDIKIKNALEKIADKKTQEIIDLKAAPFISSEALLQKKIATKVRESLIEKPKDELLDPMKAKLGGTELFEKGDIGELDKRGRAEAELVKQQYCVPSELQEVMNVEFTSRVSLEKLNMDGAHNKAAQY